MLEKSFGMFYYLKHSKNQKNNNKYVYLRITVDGERRDKSIKRQWAADQWNPQLGRALGYNELAMELNSYLEIIANKVFRAKSRLVDDDKQITAENIKNILNGNADKKHFIMKTFQVHNNQMRT